LFEVFASNAKHENNSNSAVEVLFVICLWTNLAHHGKTNATSNKVYKIIGDGMKSFLLCLSLVCSSLAMAHSHGGQIVPQKPGHHNGQQQPGGHHQQANPQDEWIFFEAYNATGGACDIKANPHSYACTHWNFAGNNAFPLMPLDWMGALQGEWFTVTYVNPQGNVGPELYMAVNPQRPTQPSGVVNKGNNTLVGSMWIEGKTMFFDNWMGHSFATDMQSFTFLDEYTVEMQAYEGQYLHLFRCRDFNRNNNHHLLCSWDVWVPQQQTWTHKGYLGFLTAAVWNQFANGQ
jgi:hypothetical protein